MGLIIHHFDLRIGNCQLFQLVSDSNGKVEPSIKNELEEFKKVQYAYSDADQSMYFMFTIANLVCSHNQ